MKKLLLIVSMVIAPLALFATEWTGAVQDSIYKSVMPQNAVLRGNEKAKLLMKENLSVSQQKTFFAEKSIAAEVKRAPSALADDGEALWVSCGTGLYREDLVTGFFNVESIVYEVEIEKNTLEEGLYRLVNPYGKPYPYNEPSDYDEDSITYMIINATDSNYVYVEESPTTMDWGYGAFSMQSMVSYYLAAGNTMEQIRAARPDVFGTLRNGVITMPENSMIISMSDYYDGGWYITNVNGLFAVALPGKAMPDAYEEEEDDASWKSLGTGYYTDDFVVPVFNQTPISYTYEVEVQESTSTPGLYRIVNAYAPVAAAFGMSGGNTNIEIHAEDPDGVYFLEQSTGLDFGYGDVTIVSYGGMAVETNGFDLVKQVRPEWLGTLKDGVITLPTIYDSNFEGDIQGYCFFGEYYAAGGPNGAFALVLPETTGLAGTNSDKAEVSAIYSVSGAKQNGLQKGINIIRYTNGKVEKVLVK